jgi:hypothetical protein
MWWVDISHMDDFTVANGMEPADITGMLTDIETQKGIKLEVIKAQKAGEHDWITLKYPENMMNNEVVDARGFTLLYVDFGKCYFFYYINQENEHIESTKKVLLTPLQLEAKLQEATQLISRARTSTENVLHHSHDDDEYSPVVQHEVFHSPGPNIDALLNKVNHLSHIVSKMIDLLETISTKVSEHDLERWKHELSQ